MAFAGTACLAVGLITALYAAAVSVAGALTGRRALVVSGRRAIYCLAALLVAATAILQSAFLRSDFSFKLVAEGSSTDTPTFYKVTAMWATQDGSLLLWALLLSVFSSAVLFLSRRSLRDIAPVGHRRARHGGRLLPVPDGGVGEPLHHARCRAASRAPGSTRCCATRR